MSELYDPTKIDIAFDPLVERMRGLATHGNTEFDVPFMSEIAPNLWQGGCFNGLVLPDFIVAAFSLYPWEKYTVKNPDVPYVSLKMYDSLDGIENIADIESFADHINYWRETGPVLVHCQAGLNRSSLLVGMALVRGDGYTGQEAVDTIREKRSPACLCNNAFRRFLINYKPGEKNGPY